MFVCVCVFVNSTALKEVVILTTTKKYLNLCVNCFAILLETNKTNFANYIKGCEKHFPKYYE